VKDFSEPAPQNIQLQSLPSEVTLLPPHIHSGADDQLFQVQLHKVLKIGIQLLFRKLCEKFRLGASVDFTDAIYQLPFVHTYASFLMGSNILIDLCNIDRADIFSLADRTRVQEKPYNRKHHIAEAARP
jgi:hypothetical protein